jgi:hypothetical protein
VPHPTRSFASAAVLIVALSAMSAACSSSGGIAKPTTTIAGIATTTTVAERKITKFTGGKGVEFCSAFGKASGVLAVSAIASLGKPSIAFENELIAAPALVEPLKVMRESTPQETSDGVIVWNARNDKAIAALQKAGLSNEAVASIALQIGDLSAAKVRKGRLSEQINVPVDAVNLTAASQEFGKGLSDFDGFTRELNQSLGGVLVGEARQQALKEFPCLAALDVGGSTPPTTSS